MVSLLHCSLILSFFIYIIISFRPAWLARALLSFKRAQSSGNDDVDEGQKTPFGATGMVVDASRKMQTKDKRHPLCTKGYLILYMGG